MIKLLDNKEWEEKELIQNMYDDSFYYGYLGKVALSSSSIKNLYSNPKNYYKDLGKDISFIPAIRMGGLIHTLVLEPNKIETDYHFVDIGGRRTVTFQDAEFENPNKKVMLKSELEEAKQLELSLMMHNSFKHFQGGEAEIPQIGMLFGVPFRCKADYKKSDYLADLKTTSNIDNWEYDARHKWHYDIQDYIYTTLFGMDRMVFVIIDKKTHEVREFEFTEEDRIIAELKLRIAIHNYKLLQDGIKQF